MSFNDVSDKKIDGIEFKHFRTDELAVEYERLIETLETTADGYPKADDETHPQEIVEARNFWHELRRRGAIVKHSMVAPTDREDDVSALRGYYPNGAR